MAMIASQTGRSAVVTWKGCKNAYLRAFVTNHHQNILIGLLALSRSQDRLPASNGRRKLAAVQIVSSKFIARINKQIVRRGGVLPVQRQSSSLFLAAAAPRSATSLTTASPTLHSSPTALCRRKTSHLLSPLAFCCPRTAMRRVNPSCVPEAVSLARLSSQPSGVQRELPSTEHCGTR